MPPTMMRSLLVFTVILSGARTRVQSKDLATNGLDGNFDERTAVASYTRHALSLCEGRATATGFTKVSVHHRSRLDPSTRDASHPPPQDDALALTTSSSSSFI